MIYIYELAKIALPIQGWPNTTTHCPPNLKQHINVTTKTNAQTSNVATYTLFLANKYNSTIKLPFLAYGWLSLDSNAVTSYKHI